MKRIVFLMVGMLAAMSVFGQNAVDASYPIGSVMSQSILYFRF